VKFDRDIFLLVVIIGLAASLNSVGLLRFVENHVGVSTLRAVGYAAAFTGGGWIGLFSQRIASRITDWRDKA
jgi:hypothetical protein